MISSSFAERGFVIFKQPIIKPELLNQAKAGLAAINKGDFDRGDAHWGFANQHQPHLLQRIAQIHLCNQAFFDLLVKSDIGKVIAQAIGAKQVKVWGTQLYIKPPSKQQGANVGWHRDSQHIPFYPSGVITLWIPLDGCDQHSGPLTYVTSSHDKTAFAEPTGAERQNLKLEQQKIATSSEKPWHEEDVIVPQGGFSIHHWDLIHGSRENLSNNTRYGLSVGIATEALTIDKQYYDYGYVAILDKPDYCPVLFEQGGL